MKTVNILYIYGDILRRGGIESFMMNYYRHIESESIHIDFAVQGYEKGVYDDEILARGSCIYHLDKPGKHPIKYKKQLKQLLSGGRYQIVHAHCDAMNYRIMRLAKASDIPVRIAHSHNTQHILNSRLKCLFYEYCRHRVAKYATECWACSFEAGRWLFGDRPCQLIHNAIDIKKFSFNKMQRNILRKEYGIGEKEIVLGHVGRFDFQKNHEFLINVLWKLRKKGERQYRLLLVGEGFLRKKIEEKVLNLGLEDQVIFTGGVSNPEDYYHMMDLFLIPSLFEGYPLVVTEAEANGLMCIASDYISAEVNKIGRVRRLLLDTEVWYQCIEQQDCTRYADAQTHLAECGFDIGNEAKRVQKEYIRLCGESIG